MRAEIEEGGADAGAAEQPHGFGSLPPWQDRAGRNWTVRAPSRESVARATRCLPAAHRQIEKQLRGCSGVRA